MWKPAHGHSTRADAAFVADATSFPLYAMQQMLHLQHASSKYPRPSPRINDPSEVRGGARW